MEYEILFASSLSMCLISFFVLLLENRSNWKSRPINPLSLCYLLTMLGILANIGWVFVEGHPDLIFWNYFCNVIDFGVFGFIGYCWYLHCAEKISFRFWRRSITKLWMSVPAVATFILDIISPKTHLLYYVTVDGVYRRGPLFFLQQSGYFYLIITTVLAVVSYRKSELYKEKQTFKAIALFSLPAMALGLLQLLMPAGSIATLHFSLFISMLIVFCDEQRQKITIDSMTKLMNRNRFESVLKDRVTRLGRKGQEGEFFVMMGDLDRFKSINDKYGHLEGNRALQEAAHTLEKVAKTFGVTVAHLYGDEFGFIMDGSSPEDARQFVLAVDNAFREMNAGKEYALHISIGFAKCVKDVPLKEILHRADTAMYEEKSKLREK